jgi:hypothetical protein
VTEFVWDGADWLGNFGIYKVTASIQVGFVYDSVYMDSGYLAMSFAEFSSTITPVPTRDEVISRQRSKVEINIGDKNFHVTFI